MTTLVRPELMDEVRRTGAFNAEACMNCGVCTAICPMGIEVLPRELFRHVLIGNEARVLEHTEAIYSCLLCRLCEQSCPAGVRITENVRALRHYVNTRSFGL